MYSYVPELSISKEEALEIIQTVQCGGVPPGGDSTSPDINVSTATSTGIPGSVRGGKTALDLLQDESLRDRIITFSQQFDTMLGGGVSAGKITEFCGVPGVGKTQLW